MAFRLLGSEQRLSGMQKWQKFVISDDDDDDDDDEDYQPIAAQKPAAASRPTSAANQVSHLSCLHGQEDLKACSIDDVVRDYLRRFTEDSSILCGQGLHPRGKWVHLQQDRAFLWTAGTACRMTFLNMARLTCCRLLVYRFTSARSRFNVQSGHQAPLPLELSAGLPDVTTKSTGSVSGKDGSSAIRAGIPSA